MLSIKFSHMLRVATIFVVIYPTVEQKMEITIKGLYICLSL